MKSPKCTIDQYGTKLWFNEEGQHHRLDGPAIEWVDGDKSWWFNGKRHRLDGPAIECAGSKSWYIDGELHRLDGPAVEWGGGKSWYINAERLTEEQFERHSLVVFYRLCKEAL
jgi:hypothetical protein